MIFLSRSKEIIIDLGIIITPDILTEIEILDLIIDQDLIQMVFKDQ